MSGWIKSYGPVYSCCVCFFFCTVLYHLVWLEYILFRCKRLTVRDPCSYTGDKADLKFSSLSEIKMKTPAELSKPRNVRRPFSASGLSIHFRFLPVIILTRSPNTMRKQWLQSSVVCVCKSPASCLSKFTYSLGLRPFSV